MLNLLTGRPTCPPAPAIADKGKRTSSELAGSSDLDLEAGEAKLPKPQKEASAYLGLDGAAAALPRSSPGDSAESYDGAPAPPPPAVPV